jgi:hypothetical protein
MYKHTHYTSCVHVNQKSFERITAVIKSSSFVTSKIDLQQIIYIIYIIICSYNNERKIFNFASVTKNKIRFTKLKIYKFLIEKKCKKS